MNQLGALRRQLGLWGSALVLWCLLALAFRLSLGDWLPWLFLAPITAWLAFRFPIERDKLAVHLSLHVGACVLAVVFCQVANQSHWMSGVPATPESPGGSDQPPGFRPMRPEDFPGPGRPPPGPQAGRPVLFDSLAAQARFNLPIYWIIVSIAQALTYYGRAQERERRAIELEARLTEARLDALRMQLHPHFLFNTLHAISTLVHKDPDAADEMIGNLSELLRAALDTSDRQEVPLAQELAFLDRFLEIQQTRFGERLHIERQVDTALLAAYVPTLILQPLVENAIRHGIEPHPGPGLVAVVARREGEVLRLIVRDNGAGPKSGTREREGIGLANTRARLEQLYGKTARLNLNPAPDGYTAVLELPYHENPSHPHC